MSLDEVMEATADALDAGLLRFSDGAVIGTGGFIETPNQRLGVRHVLPIATPDDLAKVTDRASAAARPLRLGDVADVVVDHQPLIGDAVINDGPGLMLIVEKLPWGNTLEVTRGRRGGHRRDAARPARHRDRHHHLPAGHLRRDGDRQPQPGPAARARCWSS